MIIDNVSAHSTASAVFVGHQVLPGPFDRAGDMMLISGADMGSSAVAAVALLLQVLPDLLTELDGMDQRQRLLSLVQVRAPRVSLVCSACAISALPLQSWTYAGTASGL
jgi:hypothetical protein